MKYSLHPIGDSAVMIELGTKIDPSLLQKVQTITSSLDNNQKEWLIEYIPAFTTITLYYDPIKVLNDSNTSQPYQYVCSWIEQLIKNTKKAGQLENQTVEIPVCYGGELGPDLQFVADYHQLSPDEVIQIHLSGEYLVHMIGFAPGFPFIGGMPEKIATPRRDSPRLKIPARSVGIAGKQTGIYPIETPGGWQIIGRTPLELFHPNNEHHPSLLKAGDRIVLKQITFSEYIDLRRLHK